MDAFEGIADPLRRDLLRRLAAGPARVVDLAAAYEVSRPAVSRHLRLLTEAGLTSAEDRGRERHYRLELAPLVEVRRFLDQLYAEPAEPSVPPRFGEGVLDALDTEVRRTRRDRRDRRATRQHIAKEQTG
jgi:DNA-binding transcriptional ArsR family regulator